MNLFSLQSREVVVNMEGIKSKYSWTDTLGKQKKCLQLELAAYGSDSCKRPQAVYGIGGHLWELVPLTLIVLMEKNIMVRNVKTNNNKGGCK